MGEGWGEGAFYLIDQNQYGGILSGFDHILKLLIRRVGRFEFGGNGGDGFQKAPSPVLTDTLSHPMGEGRGEGA
jgi:hypothetical protein